jgi:ribosomal protein L11 methyltransferase
VEEAGGYNPDEGESPRVDAPVTVRAYLKIDDSTDDRKGGIDLGLRLIAYLHPLAPLQEREIEEESWRKQEFEPIRVGKRLYIAPPDAASGASGAGRPGDLFIPLEPGMAFGTGHHPTTRMCLQLVESLATPGARVLDVGCGSGILGIAALLCGAASVVGFDIEDEAIEASRRNFERAGLAGLVAVHPGSIPSDEAPADSFDLVLANISSKVVIELAPELSACLAPQGALICSGFMQERQPEVEEALAMSDLAIDEIAVGGEWVAAVARAQS